MLTAISLLGGLPNSRGRKDDDGAARLSHRYTTAMFIIFSFIVTMDHVVGQRIQCWTPVHFSDEWQAYSDTYCWVKNTYYLPYENHIPKAHEEDKRQTLTYYQWVPLIMLLQALLFYVPCLIWRSMNDRAGIDLASVLKVIHKFHQTEDSVHKEKYISHIVEITNRFLTRRRDKNINFNLSLSYCLSKIFVVCGRRRGNYLTSVYLFVKFLYIVNVVGQLFLLNWFMGSNFHMYGFEAIGALMRDQYISESNRFPRVTMCDFKVRMLGNVQRYTVQCVLPINLFHEMIYLFIWFWMACVALVSVYSFFVWLGRMVGNLDRHRFMKRYVHHFSDKSLVDKKKLTTFTSNYLGADGVFLLRLIDENTDDLTTHDVAEALWQRYITPHKPKELVPTSHAAESTA